MTQLLNWQYRKLFIESPRRLLHATRAVNIVNYSITCACCYYNKADKKAASETSRQVSIALANMSENQ